MASDRYRLVSRPQAIPGCCFLSSKTEDPEGFIDLDTNIFGHGALYISVSALREVMELVEPTKTVEGQAVLDDLRAFGDVWTNLGSRVDDARTALEVLGQRLERVAKYVDSKSEPEPKPITSAPEPRVSAAKSERKPVKSVLGN